MLFALCKLLPVLQPVEIKDSSKWAYSCDLPVRPNHPHEPSGDVRPSEHLVRTHSGSGVVWRISRIPRIWSTYGAIWRRRPDSVLWHLPAGAHPAGSILRPPAAWNIASDPAWNERAATHSDPRPGECSEHGVDEPKRHAKQRRNMMNGRTDGWITYHLRIQL